MGVFFGGGFADLKDSLAVGMVVVIQIYIYIYMCQGLNSHYFHIIYIIGDGHQPNSRGLYTHYKDSY